MRDGRAAVGDVSEPPGRITQQTGANQDAGGQGKGNRLSWHASLAATTLTLKPDGAVRLQALPESEMYRLRERIYVRKTLISREHAKS